jgi:hypothetical protein
MLRALAPLVMLAAVLGPLGPTTAAPISSITAENPGIAQQQVPLAPRADARPAEPRCAISRASARVTRGANDRKSASDGGAPAIARLDSGQLAPSRAGAERTPVLPEADRAIVPPRGFRFLSRAPPVLIAS